MTTTCKVPNCGRPVFSRGFCQPHYRRDRLYGDPTAVRQVQMHGVTIQERLMARVEKTATCWNFVGSRDKRGYGRLNIGGVPMLAHRVSYEQANGALPKGAQVLHKCDNPMCVRPSHLFIGDHHSNMADMWAKGRARPGHVQGESHGCARLTEQQVRDIRASDGPSQVVAERFGISGRQVRAIRARTAWAHIP